MFSSVVVEIFCFSIALAWTADFPASFSDIFFGIGENEASYIVRSFDWSGVAV